MKKESDNGAMANRPKKLQSQEKSGCDPTIQPRSTRRRRRPFVQSGAEDLADQASINNINAMVLFGNNTQLTSFGCLLLLEWD
jgi:hypothetical protein